MLRAVAKQERGKPIIRERMRRMHVPRLFACVRAYGLVLVLWAGLLPTSAQTGVNWNDFIDFYVDSEEYDSDQWEFLEHLHQNPYNLNTVTRSQLLEIPFLEAAQADSILSYRARYGHIRHLGELLFIRNLDYSERAFLHLFLYCDTALSSGVRPLLTQGQSKIIMNTGIPLYRRDGNRPKSADYVAEHPNSVYAGPGFSAKLQYQYNYRQILQYGIGGSRDGGEALFQHGNYPFDSYSFYMLYQPRRHRIRLLAGDYKLRAGEGLLLSNAFMLDNSKLFASDRGQSADFVAKRSVSGQFDSFRGLAFTYEGKRSVRTLLWSSYTGRDANVKDGNVTSFKTDNLHRTPLERSKKNNTHEFFTGGGVEYNGRQGMAGAIVSYARFTRRVEPRQAAYTRYYFRGREVWNGSLYATWWFKWISLHGEVAFDGHFHTAASLVLSSQFGRRTSVYAGYRRFDPAFVSLHGQTRAVNSRIANEEGGIAGIKLNCGQRGVLYVHANLFRFFKPLYRASLPSHGFIGDIKYEQFSGKGHTYGISYQYKLRQYDEHDYLSYHYYNRVKLYAKHAWRHFSFTTQLCVNSHGSSFSHMACGVSVAERMGWKKGPHEAGLLGAWFNSVSYDSRTYVSGLSLPLSYRTVSLYGKGVYVSAKYFLKAGQRISVGAVSTHMVYFDRSHISSGTNKIDSRSKNDLYLQLNVFL